MSKSKQNLSFSRFKVTLLFACILDMGSVISIFAPYNLIEILTILLSLYLIFKYKTPFIKGNILAGILFSFLFFIASSIITSTPIINYKGFFLRIISAYFVICVFKSDTDDIRLHFIKVLKIVANLALINVILYVIFPPLFVRIENMGYSIYSFLFFFNCDSSVSTFGICRNPGLFWEPGVLQMPLNILIFNELVVEKKGFQKALLPIISLLTTASTTGLGLLAIIVAYRMIFIHNASTRTEIRQIFLLLFLIPFLIPIMMENSEDKLKGDGTVSTAYRLNDLVLSGVIARQYPVFGIGYDEIKYKKISNNISINTYDNIDVGLDRGNSNSLSQVVIFFGLPAFLLFVTALYKQKIFPYKKLFFLLFTISVASEPLLVTTIMMLFLFSSILKKKSQNFKQNDMFLSIS